jgi:hypothetical protein
VLNTVCGGVYLLCQIDCKRHFTPSGVIGNKDQKAHQPLPHPFGGDDGVGYENPFGFCERFYLWLESNPGPFEGTTAAESRVTSPPLHYN